MAGTALAVIAVAAWLSLIAGLALLLAGVILAAWAGLRTHRRAVQVRVGRPVPLYPKVAEVRLIERLRAEITLGSGGDDYRTVLGPVEGEISMILTFGRPDRDRVDRRRRRLHAQDPEVRYCAGRLVLQGPFDIAVGEQVEGPVLALDGDTGDYPVFRAEDPPSSSRWNFARHYKLRTEPEIRSGPVWITPSIVPESDRHAFELDVQWVEFGPDENKPLSLDMIELLRLEFPVSWGEIHSWRILQGDSAQTRAVSELMPEGRRSLELKRPGPVMRGKEDQERRAARLTLSIRLDRPG